MNHFSFCKKLGVVAHDAGGAEILSSLVRQKNLDCLFSLSGPAEIIFKNKLGPCVNNSLTYVIDHSDSIICGTGWQSDLEWMALKISREKSKPVAVFLDHWINYVERFKKNSLQIYPDIIFVGDKYAEKIALAELDPNIVKYYENPFHQEVSNRKLNKNKNSMQKILYLCEPVTDIEKVGYSEKDALTYFFTNMHVFGQKDNLIVIRSHPSEPSEKYFWVKDFKNVPIQFSKDNDIVNDINDCDIIVGRNSAALVLALILGKPAITCIPPGGGMCLLPHEGLIPFENLLSKNLQIDKFDLDG